MDSDCRERERRTAREDGHDHRDLTEQPGYRYPGASERNHVDPVLRLVAKMGQHRLFLERMVALRYAVTMMSWWRRRRANPVRYINLSKEQGCPLEKPVLDRADAKEVVEGQAPLPDLPDKRREQP